MPRKRFTQSQRYIHLNDNAIMKERGHPDHDVLHKIRPLLSQVQETINERYNPGQNLAIDEAMVAYKGRSFIKQYLPNKTTKWGFKVWSLADSSNGYICGIDIYCGRRAHPSTNGLGYDVVANLMEDHLDKHHHCYFDNFFTSVKLLDDLLAANTYACGTVRANRAGLPVQIKKPGCIKMQRDAMVAVVWHDKPDVRIISTNSQPFYTSIRPGRVAGDNCVNQICQLRYSDDIAYKLRHSTDEWSSLPQRINRDVDINTPFQSLYTSQIPLKSLKTSKVLSLRTITRTMIIYPNYKYSFRNMDPLK